MTTLYLDTETYSESDLRKVGTYAYAEHPSTEIMVAQWAVDDEEPVVEDLTGARRVPSDNLYLALANADAVVIHHSQFDRAVIRACWGMYLPPERVIDTMAQAHCHALPGSLAQVGEALGLDVGSLKDKRGDALIQLFCKPRPKNMKLRRATRETHPAEWAEFLAYSGQDIVAMRAIHKAMPKWNYGRPPTAPNGEAWMSVSAREHRYWCLTQKANDRGMKVDLDLARAAVEIAAQQKTQLADEMSEATLGEVSSPARRDLLLSFIRSVYGVQLDDLSISEVERLIADEETPDGLRAILSIRVRSAKSSTSKFAAVLRAVSGDGRLRGTMTYAGASRTGRRAHKLFQPGNMPRPKHEQWEIDDAIAYAKAGAIDLFTDRPLHLLADAVRGVIVAPPGKKIVQADLSNIEGRTLAWLAGEQWKIEAFKAFDQGKGPDLYIAAYARALNLPHEQVDKARRQIGKVMELGLGFGGGVNAFVTFALVYDLDLEVLAGAVRASTSDHVWQDAWGSFEWAQGRGLDSGLPQHVWTACELLKRAWRAAHPQIEAFWAQCDISFRAAVARPGVTFTAGAHLKFQRDGVWLRVRLPSGRVLCYLRPRVDADGCSYLGVDQKTYKWKRIRTYGGKVVENATQAVAADILKFGQAVADKEGCPTILDVHDEILAEVPDTPDYTWQRLARCMATVPPWAEGLPLAAAGFETYRYRKD